MIMGEILARSGPVEFISVAIADSATASAVHECPGRIVALEIPASAEGTSYAFHASSTPAGTFAAVEDSGGNALTFTANTTTAQYMCLEPAKWIAIRYFKIVGGVQTGATTLKVGYIR